MNMSSMTCLPLWDAWQAWGWVEPRKTDPAICKQAERMLTSGRLYSLGKTFSGPTGKQKPPRFCSGGSAAAAAALSSTRQNSSTRFPEEAVAIRATKAELNICGPATAFSLKREGQTIQRKAQTRSKTCPSGLFLMFLNGCSYYKVCF